MRAVYAILFLIVCLAGARAAFARDGGANPGGGDDCEQRFKEVAADIRKWVEGGGPKFLDYKKCGGNAAEFTKKMLAATGSYKAQCVSRDDPPDASGRPVWPVQVNGTPKKCINWMEGGQRIFRCDEKKFYGSKKEPTNDSGQYRVVHHEFAAIAGLEPHTEDDSSYCFSNQLEGFLENKKVLAIRPPKETGVSLKLSRIERSQKQARRTYPPPHCLETVKTVKAYERDGREPRVEIMEMTCPGEPASLYKVKVRSSDGNVIEDGGVGLNLDQMMRYPHMAERMTEKGKRLQRIFLRLNSGVNCLLVKVSEEGQLLDTSDCRFSNQEPPRDEAPLDEGVAPAA